jgi:hypothetical protein
VENLWTNGEFPVEQATVKYFFRQILSESWQLRDPGRPSYFVSLVSRLWVRRIVAAPQQSGSGINLSTYRHYRRATLL